MSRAALLWSSIFAGPIVWSLVLGANFALVPWACAYGWKPALHLIAFLGLLATAGSSLLAWKQWRELGVEAAGEGGGELARSRLLAIFGLALSAMFFLVILAQEIPQIILGACE